jgi:hypothetical protein
MAQCIFHDQLSLVSFKQVLRVNPLRKHNFVRYQVRKVLELIFVELNYILFTTL